MLANECATRFWGYYGAAGEAVTVTTLEATLAKDTMNLLFPSPVGFASHIVVAKDYGDMADDNSNILYATQLTNFPPSCVNFWTEVGGNLPTMDLNHSTCLSFITKAYERQKN